MAEVTPAASVLLLLAWWVWFMWALRRPGARAVTRWHLQIALVTVAARRIAAVMVDANRAIIAAWRAFAAFAAYVPQEAPPSRETGTHAPE